VAIYDFMKKFSKKVPKSEVLSMLQKCRQAYKLTDRQEKAIKHLIAQKNLTNAIFQQLTGVSKPTATRDLQNLVKQGAIILQSHGAGAHYSLVPFENEINEGDEDDLDDDYYAGLIGSWPRENGSEQSENGSNE
ncbi:MAG: DeoR family transcriptional regulator, partial [Chitinophagaceae bacterium]|nr:DeoR family transcriptional regulator [Chitinophagaceae bacterium]